MTEELFDFTAAVDDVVSSARRAALRALALATFAAADGDSNDVEIEALQAFRDEALAELGIELDA